MFVQFWKITFPDLTLPDRVLNGPMSRRVALGGFWRIVGPEIPIHRPLAICDWYQANINANLWYGNGSEQSRVSSLLELMF